MIRGLCVTLFNPKQQDIDNLLNMSNNFDYVLIYDNTEDESKIINFKHSEKVIVFSEKRNNGLSVAFNTCISKANEVGVDLLMFFDQDSRFSSVNIDKLFSVMEEKMKGEKVGMIGPTIDYQNNNIKVSNEFIKKDWLITSGSILNMNLVKEGLSFDENYFINYIEPDVCSDIKKMGYTIYEYSGVVLVQELGCKHLFLGKQINIHNPLRNYYGHRNRLYYAKKHKCGFKFRLKSLKDYLTVLFVLPNKKKNFAALKLARHDYKHGLFGRCAYEDKL